MDAIPGGVIMLFHTLQLHGVKRKGPENISSPTNPEMFASNSSTDATQQSTASKKKKRCNIPKDQEPRPIFS